MKQLFIATNDTMNILISAFDQNTAEEMLDGYLEHSKKEKTSPFVFHNYDGHMLGQGESLMLSAVLY